MTEDDYWERVRDIHKDDQILLDERYTPAEENPNKWAPDTLYPLKEHQ